MVEHYTNGSVDDPSRWWGIEIPVTLSGVELICACCLLPYLLVRLIKFFYKVWWNPLQIQKLLASQGIKGPSYKFLYGNTKEVLNMTREAMKSPMNSTSNNILQRVQPHVHLWTKLYGRNFLKWHGFRAELFVTEPDLIKEILNNKSGAYEKKTDEHLRKLFGDGLASANGKKWSRQRKLANHAFQLETLKGMVPAMILSVENMLERWGSLGTKEIEVIKEFKVLTSDVITRTAFGSNYLEGKKIFDMLTKLASIIAGNLNTINLPFVGKFIKFYENSEAEKLEHEIGESFLQIIRQRKEKIQTEEPTGSESCYLELLIHANQEADENKRISIDDMIDECKTFYLGGQETTMGLLTWIMFLLATHKDWQEKARKEVLGLFGKRHPTTEDFAKMKTITMIINETLRLYPAALAMRRIVVSPVKLRNFLLPANIEIVIPTLVTHNDPEMWGEDVHLFKPDRFAEGITKAVKNRNAYFPFGMGPRICVGLNFATIEVKIALSMILQRYAFCISPSYMHTPIMCLSLQPQHGVQIILHAL